MVNKQTQMSQKILLLLFRKWSKSNTLFKKKKRDEKWVDIKILIEHTKNTDKFFLDFDYYLNRNKKLILNELVFFKKIFCK